MIAAPKRRAPGPQLLAQLQGLFGDRLSTSGAVCLQHGRDESSYAPCPPDAVVFAESTEEVAHLVRLCAEHEVPVIAFGMGSSIEGHVLAVEGGICLDMSRMHRVLAIRPDDLTATAQAGLTREDLNRELAVTGFFFSVDPGANATLGGMVATAASGTNTVRYGTMRDNVVSLTVVTADGEVVRTASRARKSSAGYNLTQLLCGSEGTLGIVTEVTVRLHPRPESIVAAVVNFPDVNAAVACVIEAIQMGVPLARAEMLDALTIQAINAHSKTALTVAPTVFFEFGGMQAQVQQQIDLLQTMATSRGAGQFQWALKPEERTRLWTPRHLAYFACLQLRPGCRSLTTDVCVPISSLAACIAETADDVAQAGLMAPIFGHVGDGNFHCLLLIDPTLPDEMRRAEELSERLVRRAIRLEGTCTGEHGVGLHKKAYLHEEHGLAGVALMEKIKRALDPKNILNPGKVVSLNARL